MVESLVRASQVGQLFMHSTLSRAEGQRWSQLKSSAGNSIQTGQLSKRLAGKINGHAINACRLKL
jgi:hypothetical protein